MFLELNSKGLCQIQTRKGKLLSCVPVLDRSWNKAFSRRSRAITAKKCTMRTLISSRVFHQIVGFRRNRRIWIVLRGNVTSERSSAHDEIISTAKTLNGQHTFWQISSPSLHDLCCQTWLKWQWCDRRFINGDRRRFDFIGKRYLLCFTLNSKLFKPESILGK